ncbi:FecR family protein [Pseudomonas sp. S31]|uniref:FecR family protein n=1 Tax=Pseudomonas sp. S31 TaxID=1564473 RepID=UPI002E2D3BC7|nr:FecR family protein [Pseudomonas sp. S31]MBK4999069.1 FecR family protein [Pseudomonas sp. S31]
MNPPGLDALPGETVDQAIQWSIRMTYNQPDPPTRLAFEAWLASDEAHRQAWARLQSLSGRFAGMPGGLARQALERLPEARLQRRQMLNLLALFATVGTLAWSTQDSAPWQRLVADYSTRVGEHQRWTLADGSLLELNTDSAVRLRFDAAARVVELLRGELYLVSGEDAGSPRHRPLRVRTELGQFEALGTRFSVRQSAQACRLGVSEGAVRLQPVRGEGAVAQAGETWAMFADGVQRLPGKAEDAAAWRDGLLVARDMPLGEVLGELGRYRNGYLGCEPQIAQRRISGNFNLDDTDATLAFIAQAHGLRLHAVTRYWVRMGA